MRRGEARQRGPKASVSIVAKLVISYFLIIIPGLFWLAYQCYDIAAKHIHAQTERYISDMLHQTCKNVEMRMEEYASLAFSLQIDASVQNYLSGLRFHHPDTYSQYLLEQEMTKAIYRKIIFDNQIESVYVISDGGHVIDVNKSNMDYSTAWIDKERVYARKGGPVWLQTNRERQYITLTAQINSLITQEPLGYMVVNIREEYIRSIFSDLEFYNEGELVIAGADRRVVSHKDRTRLDTLVSEKYREIIEGSEQGTFHIQTMDDGIPYYISSRVLPGSGWRVIFTVPVALYASALHMLQRLIIIVAVSIAAVTILLFLIATKHIINPAQKLTRAIQRFGAGDFSVSCEVRTRDEIGILAENFNYMVRNINDLVERIYREEVLKQQAELRSLHMQINPHFLYNVLETINWISRLRGVSEIGSIAKALGDLMRSSISGSDYVTIADELKSVNNYLYIQTFRYGDKLKTSIDVGGELAVFYLPKLVLQPIVENSIVHGIENKLEPGNITITGRLEADTVVFQVRDDGVGMTDEQLERLRGSLTDPREEEGAHIGLRNADKRLKLSYGAAYGLSIDSRITVGTTVTIRFPGRTVPPEQMAGRGIPLEPDDS